MLKFKLNERIDEFVVFFQVLFSIVATSYDINDHQASLIVLKSE